MLPDPQIPLPSPSEAAAEQPRSGVLPVQSRLAWLGITFSGVRSVFRKEIIQLLRDRYLLAFIITLPIMQLLVTGLAVQRDLRHIPTVVCNYDRQSGSIELLSRFRNSTFFDIEETSVVNTEDQLVAAVRRGKYKVGMVIPPDYSAKLLAGTEAPNVDIVVDGTNANIAKIILTAAQSIVGDFSLDKLQQMVTQSQGATLASIKLNTKILYNESLQTSYFIIPAILAIIMHMMTILFTSFAIVRERETGTLEQLMVTPIRTSDLMLGKVLPYAMIGLLDMMLTLGVMVWFFHIDITGNFWFLTAASTIFILTSLGVGLLISTACQTQVQAIQLTMGLLLPSLLLTGFVFPLEPMPWAIKIISYCLPLTYYLEIIRGVVIKAVGLKELWPQTLVLTGLAGLFLWVSISRFKKQIA
jgi:ABC-2 type transport system permease protein